MSFKGSSGSSPLMRLFALCLPRRALAPHDRFTYVWCQPTVRGRAYQVSLPSEISVLSSACTYETTKCKNPEIISCQPGSSSRRQCQHQTRCGHELTDLEHSESRFADLLRVWLPSSPSFLLLPLSLRSLSGTSRPACNPLKRLNITDTSPAHAKNPSESKTRTPQFTLPRFHHRP